jgi:hypothetical protein
VPLPELINGVISKFIEVMKIHEQRHNDGISVTAKLVDHPIKICISAEFRIPKSAQTIAKSDQGILI